MGRRLRVDPVARPGEAWIDVESGDVLRLDEHLIRRFEFREPLDPAGGAATQSPPVTVAATATGVIMGTVGCLRRSLLIGRPECPRHG